MTEMDGLLQKFQSAAREEVRLRLAVEGFFSGGGTPEQKQILESYLRRRVRPMVELLLREDNLPQLEQTVRLGWLTPGILEDGLSLAIRLKHTEGYVRLLQWKAEQYGFTDRDFSL